MIHGYNTTSFVLDGWPISGLFGYMFIHADMFHLIGNMIFLWIFGNAVCAKIGNFAYLPIYLSLGLFAAVIHNIFDGRVAIGASGAIYGIVGMFLILYPLNDISCVFIFIVYPFFFSVSSMWIILLWFVSDVFGIFSGEEHGIAYWAHIGGFMAGATLINILLKRGVIKMTSLERSLIDIIAERWPKQDQDY